MGWSQVECTVDAHLWPGRFAPRVGPRTAVMSHARLHAGSKQAAVARLPGATCAVQFVAQARQTDMGSRTARCGEQCECSIHNELQLVEGWWRRAMRNALPVQFVLLICYRMLEPALATASRHVATTQGALPLYETRSRSVIALLEADTCLHTLSAADTRTLTASLFVSQQATMPPSPRI